MPRKSNSSKNKSESTCCSCKYYNQEIKRTHSPVMRNKIFYKITMTCDFGAELKTLKEKYEDKEPTVKNLNKILPIKCENYILVERDNING